VFLLPSAAALIVVFPSAAASGFAFPLACRMYTTRERSISKDVGIVLMTNTIGSAIGPVVAAFIMIPVMGTVLAILAVLVVLAAVALHILGRPHRAALYVSSALLLAVLVFLPVIKLLPPSFSRFDRNVLFYRESVEGTLAVGQDPGAGQGTKHTYVNNSAVIGSSYDAIKVVKMVGYTPFFMGLECRDVLVVGFGIGVTTSAIASDPEVRSIECVELVEGLRDAAGFYRDLNRNVVGDPRLRIIPGDGRHYLQATSKTYDLISSDPTHPILGSGGLYTKEYFSLCREHLNPGGMVSQYLPLHKLRPVDFLGIIKTFHSVFPDCTIWLGHYHAVLLGSLRPIQIDFDDWSRRIAGVGQDIHFYADPYHLAANMILDGSVIEELATGLRVNTDDRSYTEFFSPACLGPVGLPGRPETGTLELPVGRSVEAIPGRSMHPLAGLH